VNPDSDNYYNGYAYQVFLNLPFGETMAEQITSSGYYQNHYKFNGKELDNETGMYYYGARYYEPRLSVFLSVDPIAEKFACLTPYQYASNNPVTNIEIDGLEGVPFWHVNLIVAWATFKAKAQEFSGAYVRLATGQSGNNIPNNVNAPIQTRQINKTLGTLNDAKIVGQGIIDATEAGINSVGYIPGAETVTDGIGLFYNIVKNDKEGIATYSLALAIPGVSANLMKLGKGGFNLVNKLLKYSEEGKIPVPMDLKGNLNKAFKKLKGDQGFEHIETGTIYRKSYTTHGSKTEVQWKVYPEGTTDFSKNSGNRVTIDGDGTVIGN